tara:strand:+ start:87 stop:284 length:198 start_codon:yes stop_codon:yes gene_type:complete
MSIDEKLEEIQELFKTGDKYTQKAMYVLQLAKEKMEELKKSDELKHLPKSFLDAITGGNDDAFRN